MKKIWTILELMKWSEDYFAQRQIDSPRLDAELLLCETLGLSRVALYTNFDRPVGDGELAAYKALVIRRAGRREPVAYILEEKGFWSLNLKVSPAVLIPRPETERLVDLSLELLKGPLLARRDQPIVDVGTGSGAIALALASELADALLWATDLSAEALAVAQENARSLGFEERVRFVQGDLLAALPAEVQPVLVVSNPPYVAHEERDQLAPELSHEPASALFADDHGLAIIRRLAAESFARLQPGGFFLSEIGATQGRAVSSLFSAHGFEDVAVVQDYSQRDRVVRGRKPS
ncbi:MAG: protein-(glutamine-N5) methyltransferase, release factor-specific [Deltaproteobacteria bacterium CG2_30_63_29]|nr:MAG: protein-(glutamine-N5) methyltransferase, release factor-specific [Deltaproteobacteria bacterium CG2_30_63_29]